MLTDQQPHTSDCVVGAPSQLGSEPKDINSYDARQFEISNTKLC